MSERIVILDADTPGSARVTVPAVQQHSHHGGRGESTSGKLPIWMDRSGALRIAIQTHPGEFVGDFDQLIISPTDLLHAIATAMEGRPR